MQTNELKGLHGRVVQDLGRAIVSGEFTAGASLPSQEDCCARLGVSRTVLREALRVLAEKGLVDARPKAGTFVRPREAWNFLDADVLAWRLETDEQAKTIDQLYELRQMVEPMAAFLAASRAKLPDFRKMGEAFDEMVAAEGGAHSVEPDLAFHRAIIAASGNDLFASLGKTIESALQLTFRIGAENPSGPSDSLAMHKAILDAIVDRDGPAARLAMQQLIDYSKQTVLLIRAEQDPTQGKLRAHAVKVPRR